jgi:hypothetical protein
MKHGTLEKSQMTNGSGGGVLHLLRLTRTQCNAAVAFVALRNESGTIDLTVVPSVDEGSEWTLDTLHGIVRQTLEDPLIGEGRAVIRVSEVFRRYWPGERQYTRMAVAPLNDVTDPQHPWGLLCALDPVSGQFDEAQLDMLGLLAVRFMNHLRAKKKVLQELPATEAESAPEVTGETATEDLGAGADLPAPELIEPGASSGLEEGRGVEPEFATTGDGEAEGGAAEEAASAFAASLEGAETEAAEEGTAVVPEAPTFSAEAADEGAAASADVPSDVSAGEADEGEAFPAAVATGDGALTGTAGAETPAESEDLSASAAEQEMPDGEKEERTMYDYSSGATSTMTASSESGASGASLETLRLAEFVERIDGKLGELRGSGRPGALLMIDLSSTDEDSAPTANEDEMGGAFASLAEISRHDDSVIRVGTGMIAVMMVLRPGSSDVARIKERLSGAAGDGASGKGRQSPVRSAIVRMDPEKTQSGEDLVFAAVRQLGAA